jgi:hypothetical protein
MFQEILRLMRSDDYSHHQRQHETIDGDAFNGNRRAEYQNARKNGQIRPSTPFGRLEGRPTGRTGSFQPVQRRHTIHANSGLIRGIPD